MRRILVAVTSILSIAAFGACADDGAATDKGDEEQALSAEGKADSFFRPTEHGALSFGVDAQATLADGARFHAWTFALDDGAKVALSTVISANLDTVMYLYRRDLGSTASWGRYIDKNDDADKLTVASRIERALDAGEYRVIVKGFKVAVSGSFALASTCDGAGCSAAVSGECKADVFPGLTRETGFASSCAASLLGVLAAEPTASSSYAVTLSERCTLPEPVRTGLEMYHGYWDDVYGWDALVDDYSYGDEELELNVSYRAFGAAGSVVDVDMGGDEDGMTFVIDGAGQLLMGYQHNQSPIQLWWCAASGDTAADEPDEDCGSKALWTVAHDARDEQTDTATGTREALERDRADHVKLAIATFWAERSLSVTDTAELTEVMWDDGARVVLAAGGATVTYYAADGYDPTITFRVDGDGATMPCIEQ